MCHAAVSVPNSRRSPTIDACSIRTKLFPSPRLEAVFANQAMKTHLSAFLLVVGIICVNKAIESPGIYKTVILFALAYICIRASFSLYDP